MKEKIINKIRVLMIELEGNSELSFKEDLIKIAVRAAINSNLMLADEAATMSYEEKVMYLKNL